MNTENLDTLVRNATFAADYVAMQPDAQLITEAEKTRRIVRRVIEFLHGNDLMEFKHDGSELWLRLEPPFDKEIKELDAFEVEVQPKRINAFHEPVNPNSSPAVQIAQVAENKACECDRPDQLENPHRHTLDVACVYWIAGRPSQVARVNATNYLNVLTD